ncbi:MAG: hypothetical protein ACF8CQ_15765 [Rhodopirellula sp. JB044]|uniref:hypothetical protein n=1 Tax=Rhodopirellula sp. JB044 TaxID=3342844 RepID=UPI00370BD3E0
MLIALLSNTVAFGGEPWVRIEEDWELKLNQPDPEANSPQLNIYMTPDSTRLESYFQLQLNHAAEAGYSAGGLRVCAVENDTPVSDSRSLSGSLLSYDGDVVRWTTVLMIRDGELYFAIKNGSSRSWGEFGGPEYLLRLSAGEMRDLSRYTPRQSVSDVDIGFGRNRVQSLTLKTIRAYREDGTSVTVDALLDAS